MVPFKYPPGTKKALHKTLSHQDALISRSSSRMEAVMRLAVDYIIEHWEKLGQYLPPSLAVLDSVMEDFYLGVVHKGLESAKGYKPATVKRLAAAKFPKGIPNHLPGLEKIFRDRRFWPKIMKRSKALTDRVRKQYLQKLQKKFNKLVPLLRNGELTTDQLRSQLMDTWKASKPRVELIFRTESTTYFGKTQTAYYKDNDEIIGFIFDSIADRSRTDWCRSRHGIIYRPGTKELTQNTPALHWNCRSHLIPLANTAYNRKLLSDPQRDPSNRKVAPLPNGWRK